MFVSSKHKKGTLNPLVQGTFADMALQKRLFLATLTMNLHDFTHKKVYTAGFWLWPPGDHLTLSANYTFAFAKTVQFLVFLKKNRKIERNVSLPV